MEFPQLNLNHLKGEAARRDFKKFIKDMWHILEPGVPFTDGIHVDAVVDHLTHAEELGNLLICMPPGFGKSLLLVLFFCWRWANRPEDRFIFASHSIGGIARRDSMKCRRLIKSELYQSYYGHTYKISEDQDTKDRFDNDKTGFRLITSIDAGVTGERGHFTIVDDPHNVREIDSKANREAVIKWYKDAFYNRVIPQRHTRIVVQQMCHPEDLPNYLLKEFPDDWTKLILPLEAGKGKFLSTTWKDPRQDGELLCPALLPQHKIDEQRRVMTRQAFNAQYNQHATPSEDQLFNPDNFQYYTELPPGGLRLCAVDLAVSGTGDYTVFVVGDVFPDGSIFIVHIHRERMQGTKIIPTMKVIHELYNPKIIYVEDVAFQRIIIQEARSQMLPVKPVKAEGDKLSRSVMLQVRIENKQVYFPKDKSWLKDVTDELAEFPNSKFDDVVDSCSYLALQANQFSKRMKPKEEEKKETPEEREAKANKHFQEMLFQGLRM